MKPNILGLALLLLVSCSNFEPFSFVQMSDPQIGFIDHSPAYSHSDSLMKAAVESANALNPAYVFITGDLVNSPNDPIQDSVYRVRVAEVEAPVYVVPGNHDYLRNQFSFRERGCAFIGLDTNCIKDGDLEREAEQWAWLEKELTAAASCRYTFIFLHCPIVRESRDEPEDYFNFSKAQREKYIGLFKEKGVDIVFAGHTHQEYDTTIDGIRFITDGPVGNALGHGTPGYNVVRVTKEAVDVNYIPTPGINPAHCRF